MLHPDSVVSEIDGILEEEEFITSGEDTFITADTGEDIEVGLD
jgi:hypothetical protein